jgi:hypothetical protein
MPLWLKTDAANGAPKYLNSNAMPQADLDNAYFVDTTEAGVASNRAKGIVTPGWNLVQDIGNGRLRVETLVAMKVTAGAAGDAGVTGNTAIEDTVVADRQITITAQPLDSEAAGDTPITFSVTAVAAPTAALTFVWQEDSGAGFANITNTGVYSGATTNTLTISDNTGLDGYLYRVVVSSSGADSVTSETALLTEAA